MHSVTVVLVPGFAQTATSWDGVAPLVPGARAVDVPLRETFAASAHAIGAAHGEAIYVGYSMGGRLCLQLALDRPDLVTALVAAGARLRRVEPQTPTLEQLYFTIRRDTARATDESGASR